MNVLDLDRKVEDVEYLQVLFAVKDDNAKHAFLRKLLTRENVGHGRFARCWAPWWGDTPKAVSSFTRDPRGGAS